jgi:cell wall-associated NlpC family hydrolase
MVSGAVSVAPLQPFGQLPPAGEAKFEGGCVDVSAFLRVPYVPRGRDLSGWDCWGCARFVARTAFGVSVPDFGALYEGADYARPAPVSALIGRELAAFEPVTRSDLEPVPGALLLFAVHGVPFHIGIDIGGGYMLHAPGQTLCERVSGSIPWGKRYLGAWRPRGVMR